MREEEEGGRARSPLPLRAVGKLLHSLRAGKHLLGSNDRINSGLLLPASQPGRLPCCPAPHSHTRLTTTISRTGAPVRIFKRIPRGKPLDCSPPTRLNQQSGAVGRQGGRANPRGKRPAQCSQRRGATPRVAARCDAAPAEPGGRPGAEVTLPEQGLPSPSRAGFGDGAEGPPARTHRMPEQEVHTKLPTVMSV